MHPRPMTPQALAALHQRRRAFFLALLALALLALSWRATPLREMLEPVRLVASIRAAGQQLSPITAVAGFALASVLAVPLSVLMLITALAFGPVLGIAYGLCGALIGAALSFSLGRWLGREAVHRLAGVRVNHVSARLARRGVLSTIALRLVPAAPFAIVNMVAGASALRLRDFLLGSVIGMLPLVLVSAFFAEQLVRAVTQPGWLTWLIGGLTLLLVAGATLLMRRWWREAGD